MIARISVMLFVVGMGIIMAAAIVVCIPLIREQPADAVSGEVPDATFQWEKQKADAFSSIKEAELDHQMGKLSPTDYEAIRAAQEERALEAMKALDGAEPRRADRRACPGCGKRSTAMADFCDACGRPLAA